MMNGLFLSRLGVEQRRRPENNFPPNIGGGRKSEKRKTIERQLVCVFTVHYCHDNEAHLLKKTRYLGHASRREDVPMSGLENADLFMFVVVVVVSVRAAAASFKWVSDYTAMASEGGRR